MPMPSHINGKVVRVGSWTRQEDDLLAEWQAKLGNRWSAVAKKIPGRTGQQCAQRWRHKVNPNIKKEKWTEEEDATLAALVEEFGNAWAEISRRLEGRTDQQCMGRWRRHLDPAIKRDAWKGKEDCALASLHQKYGSQWSVIAKEIPGRTAQQCRARWFQVETGDDSASKVPVTTKKAHGKSRALHRRPREDISDYSETEEEEEVLALTRPRFRNATARLRRVPEQDDYVSIDDEDAMGDYDSDSPPGNLSTPLKKTSSRLMKSTRSSRGRGYDAQPSSGHSSGTAHLSGGMGRPRRKMHTAMESSRDLPGDSGDEDKHAVRVSESTPESRPSSCKNAARQSSTELASPLFLSQDAHTIPLEPHLLNSSVHYPRCARPLVKRMASPTAQFEPERTPQRLVKSINRSQVTPRSSTKRTTPGGGFRSTGEAWETSPTENVLHLFQSPQHGHGRCNLLQSPTFQNLAATPDWAKRGWLDSPAVKEEEDGVGRGEVPPVGSSGRALSRGPVARRLNVEAALRGSAAGRSLESGSPMRTIMQTNTEVPASRNTLCSPAKKLRTCDDPRSPPTSQKTDELPSQQEATGEPFPETRIPDGAVHVVALTDKESSACTALKQLSMASQGVDPLQEDSTSAQTQHAILGTKAGSRDSPPAGGTPGTKQNIRDSQPSAERKARSVQPNMKGSAHVRMRLHALLDDL